MPLKIVISRRYASVALALILAALVLLAACGGDDDGGSSSGSPTPDASSPADGSGTPEPTDDGDGATQAPTASGAGGELKPLIDAWLDGINGKVTYDYASNFGGHPVGIYTTYYLDGLDRHDWLNTDNDFNLTAVTLITDDESYSCTLFEANPSCDTRTEADTRGLRVSFLIILRTLETISDEIASLAVSPLPDEEIAGIEATCYETKTTGERISDGPPAEETVVTCFAPDGTLLKVDHDIVFEDETLPDGDLLLEATEVGEAATADFEPPAPVVN